MEFSRLIDRLVDIYYNEEWYSRNKLNLDEIRTYYYTLFNKGRIICYFENTELIAFVESWRVTPKQLERIIHNDEFHIGEEDIENGNICYLSNLWIRKDCRKSHVIKSLKRMFFMQNNMCDIFCGEEQNRNGRFRYYKTKELQNWKNIARNAVKK